MVTIIIGGSGSGKSEYAENLIVQYSKECESRLIYIATMQPYDKEIEMRIHKHHLMRQNKNFSTLECYTGLDKVKLEGHPLILLECMSNLVANEMFSSKGAKENTVKEVLQGVDNLMHQGNHLVVVTSNVFEAGSNYDVTTIEYLNILGEINRKICSQANQVIEVVHGIPIFIKKAER